MCVCVWQSEMGLAEMSKAGSHAVSAAADIAPAVVVVVVWGLTGGNTESIMAHTPNTHIQ